MNVGIPRRKPEPECKYKKTGEKVIFLCFSSIFLSMSVFLTHTLQTGRGGATPLPRRLSCGSSDGCSRAFSGGEAGNPALRSDGAERAGSFLQDAPSDRSGGSDLRLLPGGSSRLLLERGGLSCVPLLLSASPAACLSCCLPLLLPAPPAACLSCCELFLLSASPAACPSCCEPLLLLTPPGSGGIAPPPAFPPAGPPAPRGGCVTRRRRTCRAGRRGG